jgi:hypothetical protein
MSQACKAKTRIASARQDGCLLVAVTLINEGYFTRIVVFMFVKIEIFSRNHYFRNRSPGSLMDKNV